MKDSFSQLCFSEKNDLISIFKSLVKAEVPCVLWQKPEDSGGREGFSLALIDKISFSSDTLFFKSLFTPFDFLSAPVIYVYIDKINLMFKFNVRQVNEDSVLDLADHLPGEAAEALLDLAIGITPQVFQAPEKVIDPFEHPDAQRRFRVMNNVEEMERALNFPWEKWTVFLHPSQRQYIERDYNWAPIFQTIFFEFKQTSKNLNLKIRFNEKSCDVKSRINYFFAI